MGYIIMAYTSNGYQEFILPELVDSNYEIILDRQIFGLPDDLPMPMENMDGEWRFLPVKKYMLRTYDGEDGAGRALTEGTVIQIRGLPNSKITMEVMCSSPGFPFYQKYVISGMSRITIGKGENNTIIYRESDFISRNHAVMYRHEQRWVIGDMSSNGTYLNGKKVNGQEYLKFGDQITLFGLHIIYLDTVIAVRALAGTYQMDESAPDVWHPGKNLEFPEIVNVRQEKVFFKRSPRTVEELYGDVIEIEAPPPLNKTKKRPLLLTIGPSITMAIPMLMGCLVSMYAASLRGNGSSVYMFTGVITAVSSAVLAVIWALANLRYAGREEEENEELRYNAYGQYLIGITDFIKQKYEFNREKLFQLYLSGSECCNFTGEDLRLWNHNEHQEDFMTVRLGTGTVPFQAEIRIPKEKFTLIRDDLAEKPAFIRDSYSNLYSAPVCVDLRDKGIVGIIGGTGKAGAYGAAFNIIAQLAANNCYTDVKMVFIYRDSRENRERFEFAKWLPHVWTEDRKTRLIAGSKTEVGDIFYELSGILRMRTEEQQEKTEYPLPHYIIFVDDTSLIEGELLENYIYNPRPEYGITTVLLAEQYKDLPNNCEYMIQNDGREARFFHVYHETENSRDLSVETVPARQLETLSRTLCDVEVKETFGKGEIPDALDFFEMYQVRSMEQLNVIDRWKKNRNYDNMRVPIGQKSGGSPCYLDIHEKYHGPHGLVAGTTGSGKSETLQTYILSLAVNFSPDDIAFFIIDFKGGGMANLFANLPHMAGQISNLSGNQVRRAMISIKSENERRQRMFAEYGVNNINLYTRLYKNHEAKIPIPHLLIIIDEFAELKREEPEFMRELISVAQVGRSLGVHLILATQKPSGTVDDNIWSNSKFRLCLRVQDKQDSNDMLHKADAAYITQAGRGYLQVGNDEIYEQFQSGYSGAEYIEDPDMDQCAAAVRMTLTGKELAAAGNRKKKGEKTTNKAVTQLDAVIAYLNQTAQKYHYDRRMLLWLPVLPKRLYLSELEGYHETSWRGGQWKSHSGAWELEAFIGLYDDPAKQSQKPLKISFSDGGHLAVFGTVATGKSTFLQTLLYSLTDRCSPQELNFYVLDYSSRMLLPFEQAPHCGGVIIDTDEDKVKKFFFMMNRIMDERKNLFRGGNYSQYFKAQQSLGNKAVLPAVLVVVDNYSAFREKTNNKYDDAMIRLSREGVGYGIFLAVSASGIGANEVPTRVGDNIHTLVSLEMGDKFKYAETLRTSRVEIMPETDVKGRGLAWIQGSILEFQTAVAVEAADMYQMTSKLENRCMEMKRAWTGEKARSIPVIPQNPVFSEFVRGGEYRKALADRRYLPFAYDSLDASVYSVDLWNTYCYIIQGKGRTGKKNVLKMLLYAAARKENASVCVIDLKGQELRPAAEQLGAEYLDNEKSVYEFFRETVPVFKERNAKKHRLMSEGLDSEELAEKMGAEKQVFIFIADIVEFVKSVYQPKEGAASVHAYLENITEKGSLHGFYFFGILNQEQSAQAAGRTLYMNMVSYRTGVHLGGNLSSQRIFQFGNIPFQEQSKVMKPGNGYASNSADSQNADRIVLPLVKGGLL